MTDDTQDQAQNHLPAPRVKNPAAVELGRRGGLSRSARKIEAAQRNALANRGKGGWPKGRPRKPKPPGCPVVPQTTQTTKPT